MAERSQLRATGLAPSMPASKAGRPAGPTAGKLPPGLRRCVAALTARSGRGGRWRSRP